MKKIIILPLVVFSMIILPSYSSQVKRILHKAEVATGHLEYEKALNYYDQALAKEPDNYRANAGKGMLLAEFLQRYDQAIPYLEKALKESPKDTLQHINYSLGKSYHYIGDYPTALHYYTKIYNFGQEGNPDYTAELKKRIADCKYAMAHNTVAPESEQSVKNLGLPINSNMPEYGAVVIGNDLIFTSKRQDDPKEKRNGWDGKYFESMYKCTFNNGGFSEPERYTLPDLRQSSKFIKHNEAVISASRDGKSLFVFRDGRIYQANMDSPAEEITELDKNVNIAHFQNHACISPDGNELYFTREAKKGVGGTDIYVSTKGTDGTWSAPQMLDTAINTYYDEDAPFISEDGTLYFSSNGLPGYGGFDVYKTHKENGHWTTPENLGQPINSAGDDIFFVLNKNSSYGYYSSARLGGQGDMDIYQVHYVNTETPNCTTPNEPLMSVNLIQNENNNLSYHISAQLPDNISKDVRSYSWKINDSSISQTTPQFEYMFDKPGNYIVSAKVIVYCDTCPKLLAYCNDKTVTIGENLFANNDLINNNERLREENQRIEQENKLSWNPSTVYFDFDKYDLHPDGLAILDYNISQLKKYPEFKFTISGHADSRGTAEYNLKLSAKRADYVKEYLLKNGIDKNRIAGVYALGESMLVNGCTDGVECDDEQHQMNRRVEFKIMRETKSKPFFSLSQK